MMTAQQAAALDKANLVRAATAALRAELRDAGREYHLIWDSREAQTEILVRVICSADDPAASIRTSELVGCLRGVYSDWVWAFCANNRVNGDRRVRDLRAGERGRLLRALHRWVENGLAS